MSSILDALKKLEAEKAAQQAEEEEPDEGFRAEAAEADLVGTQQAGETFSVRLTPLTLVMGGGVFALILIAISVTASILAARSSVAPQPAAHTLAVREQPAGVPTARVSEEPPIAPGGDASIHPESPAAGEILVAKASVAVPLPAPVPAPPEPPAPPAQPTAATPDAAQEPTPAPRAEDASPKPAPAVPAVTPEPAPAPVPAAPLPPEPAPTPPIESAPQEEQDRAPVDVKSLPLLRSSERTRYGLENLRLNVLREAGPNRPNGLAIINLNKVYIGEVIPSTRARLIEVTRRGIAIEIVDTKERFYVPH